jgi:hypothetical protein
MFVDEFANSILTINLITENQYGPSIIDIKKSLQNFKVFIFVIRFGNVSYNRNEACEIIKFSADRGTV